MDSLVVRLTILPVRVRRRLSLPVRAGTQRKACSLMERAGLKCSRIRPQVHPSTVSDAVDFFLDDLQGRERSRQRMFLYYLLFPLTVASYALGNWGCIEVTAVR